MRIKTFAVGLAGLGIAALAISCATQPKTVPTVIDAAATAMINKNCYEVVVRKPVKDSMVYDKELNWDLVDYRIRNDDYYGVGTAFAISDTELVTAAHVLGVNQDSLVYTERLIRQKIRNEKGEVVEKVWEIDSVKAFASNRDYVVFTAKGLVLDSWFPKADKLEFNKKIYTAGNAYGEGIVIRDGVLLDTLPENENGEWEILKSSIATNPGNSGGPLLNENFQVIGIVLQKKDDFCYALNINDIIPNKAILHMRANFAFTVFNKKVPKVYDRQTSLPMPYKNLIAWYAKEQAALSEDGMNALLGENKDDLFPVGENSRKALHTLLFSSFPQFFLQGSNDLAWFMTNLKTSVSDLGQNGKIYWAEPYEKAGVFLLDIEHPDAVTAAEYTDKPTVMMDTILKGIKFERKLTNQDAGSRILSMGAPIFSGTHTDKWGREWKINHWLMEFSDRLIIVFSTPTPQGVSILYKEIPSYERSAWMWDMKRLVDFVNVSYMGTLKEWAAFFTRSDFLFGPLAAAKFSYKDGDRARLVTNDFEMTVVNDVIKIEEKTTLALNMNVFEKKGKPVWDVRRAVFSENTDNLNYCMLLHFSEPDKNLPKEYLDEWKKLAIDRQHPYTNEAFKEEGNTKIGKLHDAFIADGTTVTSKGYVYTMFISRSGNKEDSLMTNILKKLEEGIRAK